MKNFLGLKIGRYWSVKAEFKNHTQQKKGKTATNRQAKGIPKFSSHSNILLSYRQLGFLSSISSENPSIFSKIFIFSSIDRNKQLKFNDYLKISAFLLKNFEEKDFLFSPLFLFLKFMLKYDCRDFSHLPK